MQVFLEFDNNEDLCILRSTESYKDSLIQSWTKLVSTEWWTCWARAPVHDVWGCPTLIARAWKQQTKIHMGICALVTGTGHFPEQVTSTSVLKSECSLQLDKTDNKEGRIRNRARNHMWEAWGCPGLMSRTCWDVRPGPRGSLLHKAHEGLTSREAQEARSWDQLRCPNILSSLPGPLAWAATSR